MRGKGLSLILRIVRILGQIFCFILFKKDILQDRKAGQIPQNTPDTFNSAMECIISVVFSSVQ